MKRPALQSVQTPADAESPLVEVCILPSAQVTATHSVCPIKDWYFPASQSLHVPEVLYLPAAHESHAPADAVCPVAVPGP